jgi:hypothetical protein
MPRPIEGIVIKAIGGGQSFQKPIVRRQGMIRGAEKRMIVVRTRDSRMFEEAYFVVRPRAERCMDSEFDMLSEANRILENSLNGVNCEAARAGEAFRGNSSLTRGGRLRGLVWFALGLLTGGGVASLLWVLL